MAINLLQDYIDGQRPANINNTNNTNNTNDTNNKLTTNTVHLTSDPIELTSNFSLGRETKKEESLDSSVKRKSHSELPPEWRGIKLDLYCNGSNKDGSMMLKLNVGVIRHLDGEQIPLQASLNSSWDNSVRRGVDPVEWASDPHWIRAKQHRKELEYRYKDVLRTSKIGKKAKQGGTNWVAYVYQTGVDWHVDVLRETKLYHFTLGDKMSQKQQNSNMIATGYFGVKRVALIDPKKEWGI